MGFGLWLFSATRSCTLGWRRADLLAVVSHLRPARVQRMHGRVVSHCWLLVNQERNGQVLQSGDLPLVSADDNDRMLWVCVVSEWSWMLLASCMM